MKKKTLWIGGVALMTLVGAGIVLLFSSALSRSDSAPQSAEEAERYVHDLEEQYRTDTDGGMTPQETLALFIEALETGDLSRASRYFLPEKRDETLALFRDIESGPGLERMITEARALELSRQDDERAFFTLVDEDNVVSVQVVLAKNPATGVWKITDI